MIVCSSVKACSNSVFRVSRLIFGETQNVCNPRASSSACFHIYSSPRTLYVDLNASSSPSVPACQASRGCCFSRGFAKNRRMLRSVTCNYSGGAVRPHKRHFTFSLGSKSTYVKLLLPRQGDSAKLKCNVGLPRFTRGGASGGLLLGLAVCCSNSKPVQAEAADDKGNKGNNDESADAKFAHGKRVYTDYSITGIPGDGRCLFRSVVHGACRQMGKPAPNESLQRELADELRELVADEFIKRREETEWFVEGDFDMYVRQMRKPHVWGGEPELFMASHVLKMPISVYMYDKDAGGLICIAEYGEEYGKDNPIRVLYHGFGHYDALQIPGLKGGKSRL
ncbi:OVARIAN TUMOR DOMAIN-containing deubiquitinating enzyme 4-like isoform X2 [Punica granatum]|nr:OVARIAN TUMOR DOMAIN-containing deubiquitinating enzyme 4-like isoform X2 [Punica granatum]